MSAFFQWFYRLIFSRKESIQHGSDVIVQIPLQAAETEIEQLPSDNVHEAPPVISIDNSSQEIESICHQIERTIENISANIRTDKSHAAQQTLQCQRLIIQLDHLMTCHQDLSSK
ncbi:hypothetical protein [Thiothrix subterranea]|uniref:Uncharacterized protein n=2 Tax=Thiothrix subterranea TaxID=2735563 RepID=A0AA51MQ82_9GAMM|nr:hypothetical protein [Thiothrix subterranea]MDQ5767244.1 hypothetical protein [Thiothrix subterranea]WML87899.1 hypothetical protein RCG00_05895 [Thiothrix subterranea]